MDSKSKFAQQAAHLAVDSMKSGTFGVGGLLIDNKTGKVLHTQQNRVIVDGKVNDPTAHVERQVVDWYFARKAENSALPDPKNLTIVSSLDPCMMCAGSIIASGFNVVSLGLDEFAGVDYDGSFQFKSLPPELVAKAMKSFSYFGVNGQSAYRGFDGDFFHGISLTKDISDMAAHAFIESLDGTKAIVSKGDHKTVDCDVSELHAQSEKYGVLTSDLSKMNPHDILLHACGGTYHQARQFDSAILTLPNGENLMARGSQHLISPILTPVIRIIRDYTALQNAIRTDGKGELPHLKYCQITMLHGPGRDAVDIATLGAYGSAMEGPIPQDNESPLTFFGHRQSARKLDEMLSNFPPLYRDVIGLRAAQRTLG